MSLFRNWTGDDDFDDALSSPEARAEATQGAARTIHELHAQLQRVQLASEAMWSLVREKLGLTDADLAHRVNELDLSDGTLDGKMRRTPVSCPKCNRTISPRLPKCMYCGQAIVHKPFA